METKQETLNREVNISRVFDAPRELVFKAWSDPEHLKNWYAPNGCTIDIFKLDFKKGGELHTCIRNPQYGDCWIKGIYDEIIIPERIVLTQGFSNEAGNLVDDSPAGKDPEWPNVTILTVTFEDMGGKTKLTIHQNAPEDVAKRTGAYQSWLQMLDNLAAEVAK
jgi:uncharacterized protein YndB with AHSA1/START domain